MTSATPTTDRILEAAIEADGSLPIIRITRDFAATPDQLMRAHLDPQLFVRWIGPDEMDNTIDVWDVRDGGSWRYVARRDGAEFAFRGCFHRIGTDTIVQTFTWEGMPEDVALETVRFVDLGDGRTRLEAQSLVDSFEGRDAWLRSGMEAGVHQGYAKLDRVLADQSSA
jgi:uncharacterized protein YndB with AHSA1/START domain